MRQTLEWIADQQITITRDDKSRKLVMLKKETYDNYIKQYIRESKAEVIAKNPTDALVAKVNRILKHHNLPNFISRTKIINPACPRIFAFIKTHKEPPLARPIVEKRRSPTYNIEKFLAKWCNVILANYNYSINSSCDFLERLRRIRLADDEVMTVFDFELYPSLNLNATCLLFYRFLLEHTPIEHQDLALLRDIAYLICHESYFEFRGMFYKQLEGVPIGSPMAGVLAEIVVREVEQQLHHSLTNKFSLYSRYVDNIFVLWKTNHRADDLIQHFSRKEYGLTLS